MEPKVGDLCLFSDIKDRFQKNLGVVGFFNGKRNGRFINGDCLSWEFCKPIKISEPDKFEEGGEVEVWDKGRKLKRIFLAKIEQGYLCVHSGDENLYKGTETSMRAMT